MTEDRTELQRFFALNGGTEILRSNYTLSCLMLIIVALKILQEILRRASCMANYGEGQRDPSDIAARPYAAIRLSGLSYRASDLGFLDLGLLFHDEWLDASRKIGRAFSHNKYIVEWCLSIGTCCLL